MKRVDKGLIWMVASAALALAVPPLLLRAAPEGFEARAERVARMSPTERRRLDRNAPEFLRLTSERQQHYRDMAAQLAADDTQNGGRTRQAMEDYYAWVRTLPRFQQATLSDITDPMKRIAKVEEFLEQQKVNDAQAELHGLRNQPGMQWMFQFTPLLTSAQLAAIMTVLESKVPLSPSQRARLDPPGGESLQGITRYLEFFKLLNERQQKLADVVAAIDLVQIRAAFPDAKLPAALENQNSRERSTYLVFVLTANLRKEFELELRRRRPSDDELRQMVANWPADKQGELDEMLEWEPSEFRRRLERQYAADTLKLDFDVIRTALPWDRGPRSGSSRRFGEEGPRGRYRGPRDDNRPGGPGREGERPGPPRGEGQGPVDRLPPIDDRPREDRRPPAEQPPAP